MSDLKDWISGLDRAQVPDLWPPGRRTRPPVRRLPSPRSLTIAAALLVGLLPIALVVVALHRGSSTGPGSLRGAIRTGTGTSLPLIVAMDFPDERHGFMVRCTDGAQALNRCHGRALFATTDAGATWQERSSQPLTLIDFTDATTGYGAMNCPGQRSCVQIVKTDDAGRTWKTLGRIRAPGLDVGYPRDGSLSVASSFWFLGGSDLFTSSDGRSWTRVPSPCPASTRLTSVAFVGPAFGYAACEGQPETAFAPKTILRTEDAGRTWQAVSRVGFGSAGTAPSPDLGALPGNGYLSTLAFTSGFQAGFLMTDRGGVLMTKDGGRTFRPFAPTDDAYTPVGVGVTGADSYLLALLSGQILSTTDGGTTWTQRFPAPTLSLTTPFAFSSPSDGVAFGAMGVGTEASGSLGPFTELYATHDGGASWAPVGHFPVPADSVSWLSAPSRDLIYAIAFGGDGDVLYRSSDGGRTWGRVTAPPGPFLRGLSFVSPEEGYVLAGNHLYRTTDGGNTWTVLPTQPGVSILSVARSSASSAQIVLWGGRRTSWRGTTTPILASTDGGQTFTTFLAAPGVDAPAIFALDAEHVWVGVWTCPTASGATPSPSLKPLTGCTIRSKAELLRTADGGRTWTTIHLPFAPEPDSYTFVTPDLGFWLSPNGLLVTHDGGVTWRPS